MGQARNHVSDQSNDILNYPPSPGCYASKETINNEEETIKCKVLLSTENAIKPTTLKLRKSIKRKKTAELRAANIKNTERRKSKEVFESVVTAIDDICVDHKT